MNLNDRQRKLVTIMLKQFGSNSISYYAEATSTSERTIYNDLEIISEFLLLLGYKLIKDGSKLEVVQNVKKDDINEKLDLSFLFSDEELRRVQIFKSLLFEAKTLTYDEMSSQYFVSKTSIIDDINYIKNNLLDYPNMIQSDNAGTKINALEIDIQKSMKKFNDFVLAKISSFTLRKDYESIFYKYTYGAKLVDFASKILLDYIFENVETIDEFYIDSILNIFIVLIYRLEQGIHIENNKELQVTFESDKASYNISKFLLNEVSESLDIRYNNHDLYYLASLLRGNKISYYEDTKQNNEIVDLLIESVSEFIDFDLSQDQILKKQLMEHFGPMLFRLENKIINPNPFNIKIIEKYFLMNGILWYSVYNIEKKLGVKFTQDEISFLVIYFQLAMERRKTSKQVLIVCPLGISTSHILENEIRRILPPIDIISVKSLRELEGFDYSNVDMVLSTIRIDLPEIPHLIVSAFLTAEDKRNILSMYEHNFITHSHVGVEEKNNQTIDIDEITVFDNLNFNSKDQFLNYINEILLTHDYVQPEFIETMMQRETLGNTDFRTGVAIPHGIPEFVNKSAILAFINRKKVKWNEEFIYVVLVILLKQEDMCQIKEVYKKIYSIIKEQSTVKLIFDHKENKIIEENLRWYL